MFLCHEKSVVDQEFFVVDQELLWWMKNFLWIKNFSFGSRTFVVDQELLLRIKVCCGF